MDVGKALRRDSVAARAEAVHKGRGAEDAGRVGWVAGGDLLGEDEDEGGGEECVEVEEAEFRLVSVFSRRCRRGEVNKREDSPRICCFPRARSICRVFHAASVHATQKGCRLDLLGSDDWASGRWSLVLAICRRNGRVASMVAYQPVLN